MGIGLTCPKDYEFIPSKTKARARLSKIKMPNKEYSSIIEHLLKSISLVMMKYVLRSEMIQQHPAVQSCNIVK